MKQNINQTFTGHIWCLLGKSASGKDTVYHRIIDKIPWVKPIIMTTTRPMRDGELDGRDYHFVTASELNSLERDELVIERRDYDTRYGVWSYAIVDDGQIYDNNDYLLIETPAGFESLVKYYGEEHVVPIYIQVDDKTRLERALERESRQITPKYDEMCRRFLADENDFKQIEAESKASHVRTFNNSDSSGGELCATMISCFISNRTGRPLLS